MLERAVDDGYLLTYKVEGRGGDTAKVSHLLFANDTLDFCKASQDQITFLCCL